MNAKLLSLMTCLLLMTFVAASAAVAVQIASPTTLNQPKNLFELLKLEPGELAGVDIARMNLLCAENLILQSEDTKSNYLRTLDDWAARVKTSTSQNLYRYNQNPEQFERSEAYFRMLVLATVLQKEIGVGYDENLIQISPQDGNKFFENPSPLFLVGLLGPELRGTCASLPVLYIAVGRRLGYPLKLVAAKSHLFVRWEGTNENLNIEAASRGLVVHPDDYYLSWPGRISPEEVADGQYLKSLTSPEELAEFLVLRACCLAATGKQVDAKAALTEASRLAPHVERYKVTLAEFEHSRSNSQ